MMGWGWMPSVSPISVSSKLREQQPYTNNSHDPSAWHNFGRSQFPMPPSASIDRSIYIPSKCVTLRWIRNKNAGGNGNGSVGNGHARASTTSHHTRFPQNSHTTIAGTVGSATGAAARPPDPSFETNPQFALDLGHNVPASRSRMTSRGPMHASEPGQEAGSPSPRRLGGGSTCRPPARRRRRAPLMRSRVLCGVPLLPEALSQAHRPGWLESPQLPAARRYPFHLDAVDAAAQPTATDSTDTPAHTTQRLTHPFAPTQYNTHTTGSRRDSQDDGRALPYLRCVRPPSEQKESRQSCPCAVCSKKQQPCVVVVHTSTKAGASAQADALQRLDS